MLENNLHYAYEYDKVVLEVTGEGAEAARNVYGSMLVSRKAGGDKLYYRYNGHGDVTALINGAGQVVASYSYDAFGNHESQTGIANNPYRYAGYDYDEESGLYYLKARMYNPEIARFLQEDTYRGNKGNPQSLNLYTYVVNNPLIYFDFTGHFVEGDRLSSSQEYNPDVEVLQNELVWLGYMDPPADGEWGYYGPKTIAAVNKLKADRGLGNTGKDWGVVGEQTWRSLGLLVLSKKDQSMGVRVATIDRKQYLDVTVPVKKGTEENAAEAKEHGINPDWFTSKVGNDEDWDVKREKQWEAEFGIDFPGKGKQVLFNGIFCTPEDIGNIHYGYVGKAAGFPDTVLFIGGGAAAISGREKISLEKATAKAIVAGGPNYGDDENDHKAIVQGIKWFENGW